jgi:hypothetical protein
MQALVKGHTSALSIQMTACDWAELGMRPRLEPMATGSSLAMCTRVFGPNLALLHLTPLRMLPNSAARLWRSWAGQALHRR